MRSKDGELLTTPDNIKDRWVEHFSDLLNQPSDVNFSNTIIGSMDSPIEMQKLDKALSNTKLGKSPGSDGIIPVVLVHGGFRFLRDLLLILFNIFWTTEDIPSDLINPNITILFKKGDRSMCGNYRGISLLSVVGKLFADIILQRLQLIAEFIYPQSQSGYRNGRSTIDGIFTIRQLMEKTRAQRRSLYILYLNPLKPTSIDRKR